MKDKSPALQFYPKQILGDDKVLAMDWDSIGMHHWLLWISWQQEPAGTLPDDDATIRRWLRSPSDDVWRRVKPQIMAAWPIQDGRRVNAGMLRTKLRQDKRKNATASARSKRERLLEDEEEVSLDVSGSVFEKAWKCYPRKDGKPEAEKAWGKAINRESAKTTRTYAEHEDFLYQRVMTYSAYIRRRLDLGQMEKDFIPYMATWLNKSRYGDGDDPSTWTVTRQEQRNGNRNSKAEQRVADVAETTREVFGGAGGLPSNGATGVPDATASRGAGGVAGDAKRLLTRGTATGGGSPGT